MLRNTLRILTILLFPLLSNSQTDSRDERLREFYFSKDTVVKKGTKFRVSNYAIQINLGAMKFVHDQKTQKYFGNYWSNASDVLIYYKNILFGGAFQTSTIKLYDTLYFSDNTSILENDELEIYKNHILFGYGFNLPNNFYFTPYAEWATSSVSDTKNQTSGLGIGFYLNKFIPLRPKRYLVLFINSSYNQSNYSNLSSSLGDNLFSFGFGIGYRFWLLKKIKE